MFCILNGWQYQATCLCYPLLHMVDLGGTADVVPSLETMWVLSEAVPEEG